MKGREIIKTLAVIMLQLAINSLISNALANIGWELAANNAMLNSDFNDKSNEVFVDDIQAPDEINKMVLDNNDLKTARVWGISELDMKRYKALMVNKSGQYYKNKELSPIEVLGINAQDNTQRNLFAQMLVKANIQRFAKELAFEKAYANAYKNYITEKKLPIIKPFNTDKYSPFNYKAVDLQDNDKLMLFVKTSDAARRIISPLLSEIINNDKVQWHIYLMDKSIDKNEVFNWARKMNIPSELVGNKTITLNIGYQDFKKINLDGNTPVLYLVRNGSATEVDLSRF